MALSEIPNHGREQWQLCANKLNQSTIEMCRRSTSLWHDSKYRCHQTTMEAWHRSADTLSRSKIRCHQSTVDVLTRSANKWRQSTECLHSLSLTGQKQQDEREKNAASTPDESAPSTQSRHFAQAQGDFQPLNTPGLYVSTAIDTGTPTSQPIQFPRSHENSAEEQIRDILNLTDRVMYEANHAKQLKSSKTLLLGEIELDWINSTVSEASSAARDLAKLVEPYRLDILKRNGRMRSAHRKSWTLVDCLSACEKFSGLVVHQERLGKVSRHLLEVSESKGHLFNESSCEIVAELPAEMMEPSQPDVELPSASPSTTPESETTLVELPANSLVSKPQPLQLIPKIIVTQAPDEPLSDDPGTPLDRNSMHDNEETDVMLY